MGKLYFFLYTKKQSSQSDDGDVMLCALVGLLYCLVGEGSKLL